MNKNTGDKFKNFFYYNSLFVKIAVTASILLIIFSIVLVYLSIDLSKEQYVNAYAIANTKVMNEIANKYEELNDSIANIFTLCDNDSSINDYFTSDEVDDDFKDNIDLQVPFYISMNKKIIFSNLVVIGKNKSFNIHTNGEIDNEYAVKVLTKEVKETVFNNPSKITFKYIEQGITRDTKEQSCVIALKAITNNKTKEPIGIAIVTIKETQISSIYSELIDSDINKCLIINSQGRVMFSNKKEISQIMPDNVLEIVKEIDTKNENYSNYNYNNKKLSMFAKRMPNVDCYIISIVNETALLSEITGKEVFIFTIIGCLLLTMVVFFVIIKNATKPLTTLTKKLPKIAKGEFTDGYLQVTGSGEIRELTTAYNNMLGDLNSYVDQLVTLEKEKRLAEIKALQMQIHPHFVYNTLTCIKFLIWQGDTEKSVLMLDAFVQLLRNTISNHNDIIPIKLEVENLKNYVSIQEIRYGDKVKLVYNVSEDCNQLQIPKLLLQPFVENAFFHAFATKESGQITIFINKRKDTVICEVIDNGIGMSEQKLKDMWQEKVKYSSDNLNGIGVKNVNDRIHLLYGENFGVNITSTENVGTSVKITLPATPFVEEQ